MGLPNDLENDYTWAGSVRIYDTADFSLVAELFLFLVQQNDR